ncbi:MAG: hypothetical protein M3138_09445 [Actinomycetota bacterium]|nr:hypothetical protein [Actinomycetota bacterium]
MKLAWERPGIVRLTARIEEVAALVAGGRVALGALEGQPGERSAGLARVLADFDRAARALRREAEDTNQTEGSTRK